MSKPLIHAISSVKKFGGKFDDYLPIHNFMDSSKGIIPDNRHRAFFHNSWALTNILEKIFGVYIINSDGKKVSVRDIGEQHILEDFNGFIPTAQDYLQEMEYKSWMHAEKNHYPPSHLKIIGKKTTKTFNWKKD